VAVSAAAEVLAAEAVAGLAVEAAAAESVAAAALAAYLAAAPAAVVQAAHLAVAPTAVVLAGCSGHPGHLDLQWGLSSHLLAVTALAVEA